MPQSLLLDKLLRYIDITRPEQGTDLPTTPGFRPAMEFQFSDGNCFSLSLCEAALASEGYGEYFHQL